MTALRPNFGHTDGFCFIPKADVRHLVDNLSCVERGIGTTGCSYCANSITSPELYKRIVRNGPSLGEYARAGHFFLGRFDYFIPKVDTRKLYPYPIETAVLNVQL